MMRFIEILKEEHMEEEKCNEIKFFELQNLPKNTISYIKKGIEYYLDEKPFSIYGW